MRSKSKTGKKPLSPTSPHLPGLFSPDSSAFSPLSGTEGMGNEDWGQFITFMPLPCPPSQAAPLLQWQVPPKGHSLSQTSPMYALPKICRFSGITPAWVLFHEIQPFRIRKIFRIIPVLFHSLRGLSFWQKICSCLDSSPWIAASLSLCGLSPSSSHPSCLLQLGAFCWNHSGTVLVNLPWKGAIINCFCEYYFFLLQEPRQWVLCYD